MPLMMPSPRALGAALAATVALVALTGAEAADFDRSADGGRYADPYDDPRYADIYGQRGGEQGYRYRYVDRSDRAPPEERYQDGPDVDDGAEERYAEDRPEEGVRVDRYEEEVAPEDRPRAYGGDPRRTDPPRSYKDDDVAPAPRRYSDAPLPGPRHYREERYEPPVGYRHGCTPRREIRRALMEDGWFDFSGLELRGDVALIHARRDNGRVFALKLDRCTGRVLRAEVISPPDHGRWVAGPRRFYPTY